MSATVTSGFDRWHDDRSRAQSVSAANDDTTDDAHDDADADTPIAPNAADDVAADVDAPRADDSDASIAPHVTLDPESDPSTNANADPNAAKRFLTYAPFAKQCNFHKSPAKYRLFGGAAGPGKSMALLMEAVVQANDNMGSNTLLLRRTFPELEQSLLLYFRKEIPRELYSSFNDSKHVVTWLNGSTTRFGYCAAENDVYQYQGAEFLFIGIDELTLFTLRQWQFLTSRNRCPIAKAFPNMAGATNPGNIGHAWVKSLWIDKQPAAGMENPECYDPSDYDFISARVHDNPIYAADQNYLKTLAALPSHLRRAFLDGDWEVFAGQYFDNFDVTRHIARAETIDWKPWWPRWISIDWGFEHPSATYWHAAAPSSSTGPAGRRERENGACANETPQQGRTSQAPNATSFFKPSTSSLSSHHPTSNNGANVSSDRNAQNVATCGTGRNACATQTVITYREYVTHRTAPRDLAHEIIARSVAQAPACASSLGHNPLDLGSHPTSHPPSHSRNEKIDAIYLSPDAFARRTDEASIADQMGDVFAAAGFPRPIPADNDRIGGWMLMYQMLDADEWLLTDNCIELIRTIPTLVRDMARIEDVEKMDGDDPADAARYGLKSRYATRAAHSVEHLPYEARLAARVLSADPTVRAIQALQAQLEEQRRTSFVPRRRR